MNLLKVDSSKAKYLLRIFHCSIHKHTQFQTPCLSWISPIRHLQACSPDTTPFALKHPEDCFPLSAPRLEKPFLCPPSSPDSGHTYSQEPPLHHYFPQSSTKTQPSAIALRDHLLPTCLLHLCINCACLFSVFLMPWHEGPCSPGKNCFSKGLANYQRQ